MERLFSYGALQQKDVQQANFDRELELVKDSLPGYVVAETRMSDKRVSITRLQDTCPHNCESAAGAAPGLRDTDP